MGRSSGGRLGLRRPAAAAVLVAVVVTFAWWHLLWKPQSATLAAARNQQQQATADLVTASQTLGHLKHLKLLAPQLAALEDKISTAVPSSDEIDQFLLQLNAVAGQTGVAVQSLSPGNPSAGSGYSTISLQMTVAGGYFNVQQFIDALRSGSRLVIIDTLTESPTSAAGAPTLVTASISAHILTGLSAESAAAAKAGRSVSVSPPTTAPTGFISGPVSAAHNAVNGINQATAGGH
jgi:Tfp pilus assembly protein PilO